MNTIRWGIIGVGDVTERKSGPALQKTANSELVAVMRRSADKAKDYAERHQVPKWYNQADELIADPDVNAIYIATPPSSHKEYTLQVAAAGKPVFVEKPMALTSTECEEMITACEEANVPLYVAYYRRKLARFEKMRELIQEGAIGTPRAVLIKHFKKEHSLPGQSWKVDPLINGGGYFVDMQAHTLDWLDYVFGPAINVQGISKNQAKHYEAEDAVAMSVSFPYGVLATGIFSYSCNREEESVTVYGSSGEVSMGFFQASPVTLVNDAGEQVFDLPDPPHVHQPLVETIVQELLGGAPSPSNGYTALRTTRVIEQILA